MNAEKGILPPPRSDENPVRGTIMKEPDLYLLEQLIPLYEELLKKEKIPEELRRKAQMIYDRYVPALNTIVDEDLHKSIMKLFYIAYPHIEKNKT